MADPVLMDEDEAQDWRDALVHAQLGDEYEVRVAPWLDEPLPERRYVLVVRGEHQP